MTIITEEALGVSMALAVLVILWFAFGPECSWPKRREGVVYDE